jgi:hypothetical protein
MAASNRESFQAMGPISSLSPYRLGVPGRGIAMPVHLTAVTILRRRPEAAKPSRTRFIASAPDGGRPQVKPLRQRRPSRRSRPCVRDT